MELRIRVGAAVDRSMSEAFRPLIKAAEQARGALERTSKRSAATAAGEAQRAAGAEVRAYGKAAREIERWEREKARLAERSARAREKAAEAAASADVRAAERAAREKARIEARERSTADRTARVRARAGQDDARHLERIARAGVHQGSQAVRTVVGLGGRAARGVMNVTGDIVRGAGVSADVGALVSKNSDLQTQATQLSNAGFLAGDARNGIRVDPRELEKQALDVGARTGTDANTITEGLGKYTAKTGDLATGRDVLERMSRLSKATGANLGDMLDAAGDIGNALGDVEGKSDVIYQVMASIAAQGKEGAVEIKDFATQMAKLSAASSQFSGNRKDTLLDLGAMVQMTRAKGGAASATQAATSLGSFTNTFSKGARLKAFDSFGVDIMGGDGKLSLKKIITGSLRAAEDHGGEKDRKVFSKNMGQMFMDVAARRTMKGWETTFIDAGGGAAGIKAVEEAFDRLRTATIAEEEIAQSFAAAMRTSQSQAEVFNQNLRKSALEIQESLMPALVSLAPAVIEATKSFANVVTWLTGDKQLQGAEGLAKRDVGSAIASTDKQLAGGKISSAQIETDRIAENEAREAFSRASAEYEQAKQDQEARASNPSLNERVLGGFDKFMGTDVSGTQAEAAKVESKRAELEETRKLFLDMKNENVRLRDLISKGLVVTVSNFPQQSLVDTTGTRTPPRPR